MKISLIGGCGFIGKNFCEALVARGHAVRVFDRPGANRKFLSKIMHHIEWIDGDFAHPNEVGEALRDCEVVFHLVSTTLPKSSNENPTYDAQSNIVSSVHLLEAAKRSGVRKVVFVSSGGTVYGIPKKVPIPETHQTNPICAYGISKLAIEKYLAFFHYHDGLDYTILRISNAYGPYQQPWGDQGAIAVFLNRALTGEAIEIWGDGSVTRDFIYISDVVDALLRTLDYRGDEHVFNLGCGQGHTLNEIIDSIESVLGYPLKRRYMQGRALDVPINVLDISRIRKVLGWEPKTSLMDGIWHTLEYLRASGDC